MKIVNSTVRVPQPMYQAVKAVADRVGMTYSGFVKSLLAPVVREEMKENRERKDASKQS